MYLHVVVKCKRLLGGHGKALCTVNGNDYFFCFFCFWFAVLALAMHKATPFFQKTANLKFRLIYSKFNCEPRTYDCAWSRSSLHEERCLKFPEFHNQSIYMNYVENWHSILHELSKPRVYPALLSCYATLDWNSI